jgi:hypothetical protein
MYCTCSKSALSSKACSLSAVEAKRSWSVAFAASNSRIFPEKKDRHVKIEEDISHRRKTKIRLIFARAEFKFVKSTQIKACTSCVQGTGCSEIVLAMEERIHYSNEPFSTDLWVRVL